MKQEKNTRESNSDSTRNSNSNILLIQQFKYRINWGSLNGMCGVCVCVKEAQ